MNLFSFEQPMMLSASALLETGSPFSQNPLLLHFNDMMTSLGT